MDSKEIKEILRLHGLWLRGDKVGSYADLRSANLSNADLSYADLHYANLSYANLSYADLHSADLRSANLSNANLRSADLSNADLSNADLRGTILDKVNWLAWIGITVNHLGKGYGYKLINAKGEGVYNGGLNYLTSDRFEVPEVNPNVHEQCGCGVNLATFEWCLSNKKADDNRILLMEFLIMENDKLNVICPVASDGKFRVRKCRKVGEVDWSANLVSSSKE